MDSSDELDQLKNELTRERALRKALMKIIPYAVVTATADFGLHVENARAEQILNRMTQTPQDSRSYEVFDDNGVPLPLEQWPIYSVFKTAEPVYDTVVRVLGARGELRSQFVNVAPVLDNHGTVIASVAAFLDNDIVEKCKLAEILESFQDGFISMDLTDNIMYLNAHAERILGVTSRDVVGRQLQDVFPGVDSSEFMGYYRRARDERATVRFDNWSERLNSWMRVAIYVTGDRISVMFSDDTERKNLELQVHRNEQQLFTTLQSIGDAVMVTDKYGKITLLNPVAERLTGWSAVDAIGADFHDVFNIISEATRAIAPHPLERVLNEGIVVGLANHTLLLSKSGEEFPVDDSAAPICDTNGEVSGAVLVFRDMTSRRKEEARTLQNQKMESVGKLAGGIAHDFNNLLTAILGYCELAMEEVAGNSVAQQHMERAMSAAERAGTLTARLLAFARQSTISLRLVDINAIITETADMLQRLIGEQIMLVTSLDPDVKSVIGDGTQITQILVNLAINSRDAMPDGGTITITTRPIKLLPHTDNPTEAGEEPWVEIVVQDTGPGLSRDAVEHLFEPFFTTKSVGEGTGLGLATSYGMVMQMDGRILYEAGDPAGATFRVQLPMASSPFVSTEPIAARTARPGTETILVVEDEPLVRDLAVRSLRGQGYRVLEASNGKEAVERYLQHTGTVSLVVTDMVMPEMGGSELIATLRRLAPDLRVLITTGYNSEGNDGFLDTIPTLLKPYLPSELATTIRTLLDSPAN